MKKFLLSAVLGMCALTGFSQVKWDAKVGMSMSNFTKAESDMKVGYTFGVGMDYQFTDMWHLQSGLSFTSKGAKQSEEEEGEKETITVNAHYLEIPILAAAKFNVSDNMKFVINAGPYLAFGLGGKETYKYEYDGKEEKENYKLFSKEKYEDGTEAEEASMKRFDLGLQYGIGLEINDHFLVNLTGQYGFINPINEKGDMSYFMYDKNEKKISPKNLNFQISVGYRF